MHGFANTLFMSELVFVCAAPVMLQIYLWIPDCWNPLWFYCDSLLGKLLLGMMIWKWYGVQGYGQFESTYLKYTLLPGLVCGSS